MADVTYRPVDDPTAVAPDVWIVDSGPLRLAGIPIPVRMTVVRLPNGGLLLHSPTQFSFELLRKLDDLGPVQHLVAPNTVHWTYVREWQSHCPGATSWGAPGLSRRKAVIEAGLRIEHDLADGITPDWQQAIETVIVRGKGITEAALFHRPSRTLVLTDLVVNVEPRKLPLPLGIGVRLVGAAAPHGRAPVYARAAFKAGGEPAAAAAERLVALQPDRVIFAHGRWLEANGTAELRRSLDWLLPS